MPIPLRPNFDATMVRLEAKRSKDAAQAGACPNVQQDRAQTHAAFRSVVSTAKANGRSVLKEIGAALATAPNGMALTTTG